MHRRLIAVSLVLLTACTPRAAPSTAPASAAASAKPASAVTATRPASPTDTLTATMPPTATFTLTVTAPPSVPPTQPGIVPTTLVPVIDRPLTPQPGLIIRGTVQLADGTGVAGISICRNFASYPGAVVATTDANGYFESAFAFIPGDEMVSVWPMASGYHFQPESYRWRHYYGAEDRGLDFVATLSAAAPAAPFPCQ